MPFLIFQSDRKTEVKMNPPCSFETPPPTRVVASYFEMTGLEILAYHSRRLGTQTPSYWPHVLLKREMDIATNNVKLTRQ